LVFGILLQTRPVEEKMTIEIDVLNGDASWPTAKPLFDAVWPPHVLATLPWGHIAFAHAELRVLVQDEAGEALCHVGIHRRDISWNGRKVPAAGIGGVLTRADARGRGYASVALDAATQTLKHEGSAAFALLFCEPYNAPFYTARGWKPFDGEIYAEQPQGRIRFEAMDPYTYDLRGRAPQNGSLDLCGLPW
jgi:aminoglycoside 2'-N-acetyltransferase I